MPADTPQTTERPQWLVEQEAAAFREMAPYLDRLHSLGQRLGWPLGQLTIRSAVEQLERDHPRHAHALAKRLAVAAGLPGPKPPADAEAKGD